LRQNKIWGQAGSKIFVYFFNWIHYLGIHICRNKKAPPLLLRAPRQGNACECTITQCLQARFLSNKKPKAPPDHRSSSINWAWHFFVSTHVNEQLKCQAQLIDEDRWSGGAFGFLFERNRAWRHWVIVHSHALPCLGALNNSGGAFLFRHIWMPR
jgi:hypothetical protein